MKAEDVPVELVEKAGRAMYENRVIELDQGGDTDWDALTEPWREEWREDARHALAAVLPDIQAQALEDAADGMHGAQHTGCFRMTCPDCREFRVRTDVRAYLRARAARLTDTTEGTTT